MIESSARAPERRQSAGLALRGGRRWSEDPDVAAAVERAKLRLSQLLGELREREGWSQEQEAAAAGVDPQTILDLEKTRTNPQLSTIVRLLFVHGLELRIGVRRSG